MGVYDGEGNYWVEGPNNQPIQVADKDGNLLPRAKPYALNTAFNVLQAELKKVRCLVLEVEYTTLVDNLFSLYEQSLEQNKEDLQQTLEVTDTLIEQIRNGKFTDKKSKEEFNSYVRCKREDITERLSE